MADFQPLAFDNKRFDRKASGYKTGIKVKIFELSEWNYSGDRQW